VEEHEVFSKGRQQRRVKARSLLCFWAVRELGISLTDLARELEMAIPLYPFQIAESGETACGTSLEYRFVFGNSS